MHVENNKMTIKITIFSRLRTRAQKIRMVLNFILFFQNYIPANANNSNLIQILVDCPFINRNNINHEDAKKLILFLKNSFFIFFFKYG